MTTLEVRRVRQSDPDAAPQFLLLVEAGEAIAGGAFMRHDDQTAELKRIWTHSQHRRRCTWRPATHRCSTLPRTH